MHSLNPCCNGHSYIDPLSKCPSGCDLSGVHRIDLLVYLVIKKLYNKCPLLNIHMEHCYPYILFSEKLLRSSTMHLFPRLLVTDLSLMFSLATVHREETGAELIRRRICAGTSERGDQLPLGQSVLGRQFWRRRGLHKVLEFQSWRVCKQTA